jgi:predicted dehydrogenase
MSWNRREFVSAGAAGLVLGANDRIGVAMIGCGGRGLLKEVLGFTGETNTEVRAVCDTWRQHREQAAAAVKNASGRDPEQFVHYQDVLGRKDIDAVVIGTPDHQHCTQLIDAVRAGKDAYIEKPLGMSIKEVNEAFDAVKKSGRVVQVGTQVRSWQAPVSARAFVASGGLGKIYKIEQSRNGFRPYWHSYSLRPVEEEDVDWRAFLMHRKYRPFDAAQYAGWYGYRDFSHGPHSNLAVHFYDLVHYITGAKYPKSVVAMGGIYRWKDKHDAPDSTEVILDYPDDGFLVRYNTTFGTSQNSFLKFIGTRGVMDATRWEQPWVLTGERGAEDAIPAGTQIPSVETTHHMKNFLECVRSRKTPAAPIEAGHQHVVAALMAEESMLRGARMVYDPVKRAIRQG